jgi:hypothetical protein
MDREEEGESAGVGETRAPCSEEKKDATSCSPAVLEDREHGHGGAMLEFLGAMEEE